MGSTYTEADVRDIAMATYRAGFDGPLELAEDAVSQAIQKHKKERNSQPSVLPLFSPQELSYKYLEQYEYEPNHPEDDN